jgi:cytochrome oxidase Cu insertion factor (SCO1/SenC/PrrC family)
MTRRAILLVVAAAMVVGIASGVALAALRSSHPAAAPRLPELHGQASWPAGHRLAPATGLPSLRGRVSVITFMDPACTQICPVEGRELASILRRLPAAARPRIVLVSVNPQATATQARRALAKWQLAPFDAHWVLGTRAQLRRVWQEYEVVVRPTNGDIEHTPVAYLVDRSGHERTAYLFPFAPAFVQGDLARLAQERA